MSAVERSWSERLLRQTRTLLFIDMPAGVEPRNQAAGTHATPRITAATHPERSSAFLLPNERRRVQLTPVATLPVDLIRQSASRLRVLALIYALGFVAAGFVLPLVVHESRTHLASSPLHWIPAMIAIAVALAVAILIQTNRIPLSAIAVTGLVLEVVGSYGIVAAELANPTRITTPGFIGFSWVAVWTLLFTMVVPTRPRRAAIAALVSVSSVPVGMAVLTATGVPTAASRSSPIEFFFSHVFAYLLVVVMAYVVARVVYGLGTEIRRARELGSYRLVEPLGQGGMGEVWRGEHRLLARPAAIKLIRTALKSCDSSGGAEAMRRFEREAQVTAQLRSPHTVDLFDFGVAEDGSLYYVMELLDGLDAEALVQRFGPLPAERVVYIWRQICHSLSEADSRGLVHRDIKPANIFLCRYGEEYDFVKVLDFGIVKAANETVATRMPITLDQMVRGTPAYIAPEQALNGEVDIRTDIYATGCVAYWLLTGQTVFTAESPIALVMHHVRTPAAPPSTRSELPIPAGLDEVVLSCLAKDVADRPPTAKELSRRLGALNLASLWTEERAHEWWVAHGV